jgi:leader peptidase (prepilin peptidase) / N-methyltransferase
VTVLGLLVGYCALFGLIVGSFLNVVIYRVPRKESIVSPRSACPTCNEPIAPRDNVPIFSWLFLRGRCRHCHAPISVRYPLIEAATAGLFAGVAGRIGFSWTLPAYLVLAAGLLALACTDMEHLLLPKRIVYPVLGLVAALLVVAAAVTGHWHNLLIAGLSGVIWFAVFFAMNFVSPRALGFGDVRLAPVLGLALGWLGIRYVLLGFFAANLIGAIIGIALIASKRMSRQQQIPYGVFLAVGTLLAIFAGPELLRPFHSLRV